MIFSSEIFVLMFLPMWLAVFSIVSIRIKWSINYILVICSFIFYAFFDFTLFPVLLLSIIVNWILLYFFNKTHSKGVVTTSIAFNLIFLGYYKYSCFALENVAHVFSINPQECDVSLPLGISFFTFQQIAYIVDLYKNRESRLKTPSLTDYAAFVAFFPQLIAGPIARSKELLDPIEAKQYALTFKNLEIGLFVFMVGFFKKVYIADPAGLIANPIFAEAEKGGLDSLTATVGVLAFTTQIYFDFSGYAEMAVGLGLMIGIGLPWNFALPYAASSIVEFWRRWHITLSTFLRDYLYIPMGGNRKGPRKRYIFLMITMLLGGLWHGASWTFVAWGALHGLYLIVAHSYQASKFPKLPHFIGIPLTLSAVMFAWIFFRAATFSGAGNIISSLVVYPNPERFLMLIADYKKHYLLASNLDLQILGLVFSFLIISLITGACISTQSLMNGYEKMMADVRPERIVIFIIGAWLLAYGFFLQSGNATKFIYFDF